MYCNNDTHHKIFNYQNKNDNFCSNIIKIDIKQAVPINKTNSIIITKTETEKTVRAPQMSVCTNADDNKAGTGRAAEVTAALMPWRGSKPRQ